MLLTHGRWYSTIRIVVYCCFGALTESTTISLKSLHTTIFTCLSFRLYVFESTLRSMSWLGKRWDHSTISEEAFQGSHTTILEALHFCLDFCNLGQLDTLRFLRSLSITSQDQPNSFDLSIYTFIYRMIHIKSLDQPNKFDLSLSPCTHIQLRTLQIIMSIYI